MTDANKMAITPIMLGTSTMSPRGLKRYLSLAWKSRQQETVVKHNVLESRHSRRAMLSYISHPFGKKLQAVNHTNIYEARELALTLHELGYQVDVIDYDKALPAALDISDYQIVCGFGEPLEAAMRQSPPASPFKINYMTGCHTYYSNQEGIRALQYVWSTTGIWEPGSLRFCERSWTLQNTCPDHTIVLGNDFSRNIAKKFIRGTPVTSVPLFYLGLPMDAKNRESSDKNRSNILWFGSSGLVHKGLHLLLEGIKDWPELTLYVAGVPPRERDLFSRLAQHFDTAGQVVDCGFLIPGSQQASEVLGRCSAVIAPSVSEGGAAAVLTAVFNGAMLPIVSKPVSLDFGGLEINMGTPSLQGVKEAIGQYLSLTDREYAGRIDGIMSKYSDFYSFEKFKERLRTVVATALGI